MVGKSTTPRRPRAGAPGSFGQLYLLTVKKCYMARFGHCEPAHAGDTLSRLGDCLRQQMDLGLPFLQRSGAWCQSLYNLPVILCHLSPPVSSLSRGHREAIVGSL